MKVEIEISNEEAEDLKQRWPGHIDDAEERITLLENKLAIRIRKALPEPVKPGDKVDVVNGDDLVPYENETLLFENDEVFLTVDDDKVYVTWEKDDGWSYVKAR